MYNLIKKIKLINKSKRWHSGKVGEVWLTHIETTLYEKIIFTKGLKGCMAKK